MRIFGDKMRLKNKVAVVTGGGGGIGEGIVNCLAKAGANVVVADVNLKNAIKAAKAAEKKYRKKTHAILVDVSKTASVEKMFSETLKKFGRLDILVNNVGISGTIGLPFDKNTDDERLKILDTNLVSVFRTAKAVAPHFRNQKSGRIISIASIAGQMPGPMKPAYSVSKMGIITLTRILAEEFALFNVTVNAINPGLLYTPLWEKLSHQHKERFPEEYGKMNDYDIFMKRTLELTPLKRPQKPEDIGNAVVFLASDEASEITGDVLQVNGGVIRH